MRLIAKDFAKIFRMRNISQNAVSPYDNLQKNMCVFFKKQIVWAILNFID